MQTFVSGGFCNEICLKTGKEQTDMLQKFYPHHEADSAYEIDYEGLYRAGYFKAMERLGTGPADTMFVGDQLFTDIWGAKKAGMETWLVKPIHPKEEIQIVLKRKLERIVLYFYHRKKTAKNRPVDR